MLQLKYSLFILNFSNSLVSCIDPITKHNTGAILYQHKVKSTLIRKSWRYVNKFSKKKVYFFIKKKPCMLVSL